MILASAPIARETDSKNRYCMLREWLKMLADPFEPNVSLLSRRSAVPRRDPLAADLEAIVGLCLDLPAHSLVRLGDELQPESLILTGT
jgi:hypothetical protein